MSARIKVVDTADKDDQVHGEESEESNDDEGGGGARCREQGGGSGPGWTRQVKRRRGG